jgi:hypothetical protein
MQRKDAHAVSRAVERPAGGSSQPLVFLLAVAVGIAQRRRRRSGGREQPRRQRHRAHQRGHLGLGVARSERCVESVQPVRNVALALRLQLQQRAPGRSLSTLGDKLRKNVLGAARRLLRGSAVAESCRSWRARRWLRSVALARSVAAQQPGRGSSVLGVKARMQAGRLRCRSHLVARAGPLGLAGASTRLRRAAAGAIRRGAAHAVWQRPAERVAASARVAGTLYRNKNGAPLPAAVALRTCRVGSEGAASNAPVTMSAVRVVVRSCAPQTSQPRALPGRAEPAGAHLRLRVPRGVPCRRPRLIGGELLREGLLLLLRTRRSRVAREITVRTLQRCTRTRSRAATRHRAARSARHAPAAALPPRRGCWQWGRAPFTQPAEAEAQPWEPPARKEAHTCGE